MKVANCSRCGAPIVWAISSKTGAKIPLDMRLTEIPEGTNLKGCFYLLDETDPNAPKVSPVEADHANEIVAEAKSGGSSFLRYGISHFKTCPNAADFSKGRDPK